MSQPTASRRTVAVVLAGGTGTRVGLQVPKQLIKVAGKSILEHTLTVFENAPEISEILLLMAPGYVDEAQAVVDKAKLSKVRHVGAGGTTRNDTTKVALSLVGDEDCNLLFHDAVRPLLEQRIITACVDALERYEAVDVAIPSSDTIIVVKDGCIANIPDRSTLQRGQTPQGFRASTIRRAYELAEGDDGFKATDDCGVLLHYLPEVPIYVVEGSEQNLKVTHPIDIFITDKLFQLGSTSAPPPLTAQDYSERLRDTTMVIFGGGQGIGSDVARIAATAGARVYSHSRSTTGVHAESVEDVTRALQQAYDETGRIDHVVLTAGILHRGPLAETDDAAIAQTVAVNYLAPVQVSRAALPYLTKTGGSLALFTSSSYTRGRADYSLYSSTKAAVVNLSQALADEWAGLGVRVNCINPERTSTPMRTKAFGDEPAGTLLSSEVVALTTIDVLLSDYTGHVVDVRRSDPTGGGLSRSEGEAADIAAALAEAEERAESELQP